MVVSIIALLVGILLPAIGKAREQANLTKSQANLRQIAIASQTYAAEFADRQLTLIDDYIASYGDDPGSAIANFGASVGPVGWMELGLDENGTLWILVPPTLTLIPYNWDGDFGMYRTINCRQFNQYLGGRWLDPVFWAPKDRVVTDFVEPNWDSPGEWDLPVGSGIQYSSYILSPAALFNPQVFDEDGFQDPWQLNAGLKSPALSTALFPELKTNVLEHHWLQNTAIECNSAFTGGYDGCQPYYFNHAQRSQPVTLFYDGHIQSVGVRQLEQDDTRTQNSSGHGLWSRDTPNGTDGYFIPQGYDFSDTSAHIFTTNGLKGRDIIK